MKVDRESKSGDFFHIGENSKHDRVCCRGTPRSSDQIQLQLHTIKYTLTVNSNESYHPQDPSQSTDFLPSALPTALRSTSSLTSLLYLYFRSLLWYSPTSPNPASPRSFRRAARSATLLRCIVRLEGLYQAGSTFIQTTLGTVNSLPGFNLPKAFPLAWRRRSVLIVRVAVGYRRISDIRNSMRRRAGDDV